MKEIEDESILVNSLPESGPRRLRIDQLIKHFRKVYEHCPEFIVRVPGRFVYLKKLFAEKNVAALLNLEE